MTMVSPDDGRPSISRTARYKKVTKPLLERKRRARINRCLDELKDLMVGAFEVEGDNISKLEKADILELTVRHLTKLHSPRDPVADAKRFQAGFGQCAAEACQFILSMPEIDSQISQNLINHLRSQIGDVPLNVQSPPKAEFSPQTSPDARSVWSAPSSIDYGKQPSQSVSTGISSSSLEYIPPQPLSYKRPDPPHVPINQSLVCDTSLNSMPRIHDTSRPITGLLMTVNNDSRDNHIDYQTKGINHNSESNFEYEIKKKHSTEVKHVIMKKIREQILGRQVREADSRVVSTESNNVNILQIPNQCQNTNMRPLTISQEPIQNASIDLRKKSKGEAKHYSPKLEIHHKSYIDMNIKEEVHFSTEAINYSKSRDSELTKMSDTFNIHPKDTHTITKKRTPDYRSMHPKKVFMHPVYLNSDTEYDNMKNYRKEIAITESNEKKNRLSFRQHQVSTSTSVHRGDYLFEPYPTAGNSHYYQQHHRNETGRLLNPEYDRLKKSNLKDQNQANNDNEQDDSMWRPW